jgi:hypothetical protein
VPLTAHRTLSQRCYRSNAHHQRGKHRQVHSNYTHTLPSHQAAHPTPALLPTQDGPWSRPQHVLPYQNPQLPSKRLSLILSILIYQIQSPSPNSTHMHVRSYGTNSTQTLLPSSGKRAPPFRNKSKSTRHVTSPHLVLRVLPPSFDTPNL